MTTRHFCDICDKEMGVDDHSRLRVDDPHTNLRWEVIQYRGGVSNTGHAHHYCILQAFGERLRRETEKAETEKAQVEAGL